MFLYYSLLCQFCMKRVLVADSACLNELMFICCFIFHSTFNICNLHSCFFKILFINLNGSMLVHFLFNTLLASREARDGFCLTHDCENPCEHSSGSCLLFRLLLIQIGLKIRSGIRLGRLSLPKDLGARSTKESGLAQERSTGLY